MNRTHLRPAGSGVPGYEKIGVLQTPYACHADSNESIG